MDGPGGKWTVQLGESGRSKASKVDGPKHESGRSTKNETGWYSKCVSGQKGVKVDGPHKMNLDGSQKCVGGQKWVIVDGPKMRGRSKKGESGRSQNA